MKIWDVALQTNQRMFQLKHQQLENWILNNRRTQITPDIWVGQIGPDLATLVMDACEAKGRLPSGIDSYRQYAELCTYVRDVVQDTGNTWDSQQRLQTCIAYSHLVYPTTISVGYAARIFFDDVGNVTNVFPGPVRGQGAYSFVSPDNQRDWLTEQEVAELGNLLTSPPKIYPERLRLALWYHEYAMSLFHIEVRWPLVFTGLEALIETERFNLTGQFARRVSRLARILEVDGFDESDAMQAYQVRNLLVHGKGFLQPQVEPSQDDREIAGFPEKLRLYDKLELILRRAVKRALTGFDFAELFEDDPSIRRYFEGQKVQRKATIEAIVGTRDIVPPVSDIWNLVERTAREVFQVYNFREIRTPVIEDVQLFQRAVGDETDIVSKEMFVWEDRAKTTREKDQWLALRPENTAGVVRAYIERKLWDRGLNKLYYIGPQFRRERPQKGRYRQFYQIGAEVIGPSPSGSESPARDAEVLEMLATLLDRLGITDWNLELNSVGTPADRVQFNEALRKALQPVVGQMCDDCQRRAVTNPLRVFDCKVPEDQPIIEMLPRITQFLGADSRIHFEEVRAILQKVGVPFTLNDRLVRGLDYYTRTAFEFTHGALGAQNAILGGGRYDGLSEALGGPAAPGIGFAIGEDRLVMTVQEKLSSESVVRKPDVYVAPMAGMNAEAARLARELRRSDVVVELGDDSFRLKKSFEAATKAGARYILIVGENEVKADSFALKNLASGEQISVPRAELVSKIRAS